MAKLFISHSSRDADKARRLGSDLKGAGFSVWLDEWNIGIGKCIPTEISEGIDSCRFLVLMLSSHATESEWVNREWKAAYWGEIERKRLIVLPVLIESCTIPTLIRTRRYCDLASDWPEGVKQLSAWMHEYLRTDVLQDFYALAQIVAAEVGEVSLPQERNEHWDELARAMEGLRSEQKVEVQKRNSLHYLKEWGISVRQLRVALKSIGFQSGEMSLEFNADLASALVAFQRHHCMRHVDGIFGPLTYLKMQEMNCLAERRSKPLRVSPACIR